MLRYYIFDRAEVRAVTFVETYLQGKVEAVAWRRAKNGVLNALLLRRPARRYIHIFRRKPWQGHGKGASDEECVSGNAPRRRQKGDKKYEHVKKEGDTKGAPHALQDLLVSLSLFLSLSSAFLPIVISFFGFLVQR